MANWTEKEKTKAIAIAKTAGAAEAFRATGIPAGTIRSWLHRQRVGTVARKGPATQRKNKKLETLRQEAVERAVHEAGDYIVERLKSLSDSLYNLATKATGKVDVAISDPEELPTGKYGESHDRDGAAWVRALVGVMAQAIDKAQLLSGKPTARPEVIDRHEYDITQRIIADPETAKLADQLLQRTANSDTSMVRTHNKPWSVAAVRPPAASEQEDS